MKTKWEPAMYWSDKEGSMHKFYRLERTEISVWQARELEDAQAMADKWNDPWVIRVKNGHYSLTRGTDVIDLGVRTVSEVEAVLHGLNSILQDRIS